MSDIPLTNAAHDRERPDPPEGSEAAPRFVWVSILGLVLFGAVYYFLYTGDGSLAGGDMRTPVPMQAADSGPKQVDGAAVFTQSCASCHQATGAGVPGVFPPLAGSPWVNGDEETAIRIVLLGIQGPIDVAGATYNGVMPAWRDALSDDQLAAVLSHVRSQWGNQAPPVRPETVATLRARYQGRSAPWKGGDELHAEAAK